MNVPAAWSNILTDLDFELPPDIAADHVRGSGLNPQVPLSLARQELSREPWLPIPEQVRERYAAWRPTSLRRATGLEQALGTRADDVTPDAEIERSLALLPRQPELTKAA